MTSKSSSRFDRINNSTAITGIVMFYHLFAPNPEIPRDIAIIPWIQKRVQR